MDPLFVLVWTRGGRWWVGYLVLLRPGLGRQFSWAKVGLWVYDVSHRRMEEVIRMGSPTFHPCHVLAVLFVLGVRVALVSLVELFVLDVLAYARLYHDHHRDCVVVLVDVACQKYIAHPYLCGVDDLAYLYHLGGDGSWSLLMTMYQPSRLTRSSVSPDPIS
jgi:hypothetical protein